MEEERCKLSKDKQEGKKQIGLCKVRAVAIKRQLGFLLIRVLRAVRSYRVKLDLALLLGTARTNLTEQILISLSSSVPPRLKRPKPTEQGMKNPADAATFTADGHMS